MIAVLSFVVAAVVAFVVYPQILDLLKAPYCQVAAGHCQLYISSPLDGLSLRIKLATYAGLFFCSPVLFWEFWRFVTPALRKSEKRYAVPFVLASVVLFAGGVLLAYFRVRPRPAVAGKHRGSLTSGDLQPEQLPEPHGGFDAGVRADLRVPGAARVPGTDRRGLACKAVVVATVGDRAHNGLRGSHHSEQRPVLDARARGSYVRLLRGVHRHRQVAASLRGRREGSPGRRRGDGPRRRTGGRTGVR